MCFHSPYAEFWHLYTFPKLLSISKEINFCLDVCCRSELALGCGEELPMARVSFQWRYLSVVAVVLSALRQKLGSWADREEEMAFVEGNKSFFQADKLWPWSFCHLHVFQQEREKATCLLAWYLLPWQEGWLHRARGSRLTLCQPPSPVLLTCDFESTPAPRT